MQQYNIIEILGSGSYGQVYKANCTLTNTTVAIKKIESKVSTWNDCITSSEVKALRKLKNHNHIIKLRDVIKPAEQVFLILDYAEMSLRNIIDQSSDYNLDVPELTIKEIIYEIVLLIQYINEAFLITQL